VILGVLGVHFDWKPQAQAVVDGVRLTTEERTRSRVMLLDQKGRVLASSDGRGVLTECFRSTRPKADGQLRRRATVGYAHPRLRNLWATP
jgi:hypothetical protein